MGKKKVDEEANCQNGCDHDKRHAVGWGPGGRKEWCLNASACLNRFLLTRDHFNAKQSHCPTNCSEYVDEREQRRREVSHGRTGAERESQWDR